jgi:hypothetical protein
MLWLMILFKIAGGVLYYERVSYCKSILILFSRILLEQIHCSQIHVLDQDIFTLLP